MRANILQAETSGVFLPEAVSALDIHGGAGFAYVGVGRVLQAHVLPVPKMGKPRPREVVSKKPGHELQEEGTVLGRQAGDR